MADYKTTLSLVMPHSKPLTPEIKQTGEQKNRGMEDDSIRNHAQLYFLQENSISNQANQHFEWAEKSEKLFISFFLLKIGHIWPIHNLKATESILDNYQMVIFMIIKCPIIPTFTYLRRLPWIQYLEHFVYYKIYRILSMLPIPWFLNTIYFHLLLHCELLISH